MCQAIGLVLAGPESAFFVTKRATIFEFRDIKMQPYLERALRHKEILGA